VLVEFFGDCYEGIMYLLTISSYMEEVRW